MAIPARFSPRPGIDIAYCKTPATQDGLPGVIFLGGFRSDMTGIKATFLEAEARRHGQGFIRFDYTGHGMSSGRFEDGTIGSWLADALDVFDALTAGPQVVVGSSMGGWIALLLARARPERLHALVCLAAAPDFTEDVYHGQFDDAARTRLAAEGMVMRPSPYEAPYPLTKTLFEDGRKHLLLNGPVNIDCLVRLIHGKADADVPWTKSARLQEKLTSKDVQTIWVEDGDHRLSRPQDLALLGQTVFDVSRKKSGVCGLRQSCDL